MIVSIGLGNHQLLRAEHPALIYELVGEDGKGRVEQ